MEGSPGLTCRLVVSHQGVTIMVSGCNGEETRMREYSAEESFFAVRPLRVRGDLGAGW